MDQLINKPNPAGEDEKDVRIKACAIQTADKSHSRIPMGEDMATIPGRLHLQKIKRIAGITLLSKKLISHMKSNQWVILRPWATLARTCQVAPLMST